MAAGPAGNVVLVHGAFVDGSTWQGVYDLLQRDGYNVASPGRAASAVAA
jgi:hypothetical protein